MRGASPALLASALLLAAAGKGVAQDPGDSAADPPTWAEDVAPVLHERCVVCHRRGSIGPMELVTYEDARRWAPLIEERVRTRIMPPWHLDPTVGVRAYRNDRSLSEAEIETVVRWVRAGAPRGDAAEVPPPPSFPDDDVWRLETEEGLGPPDLVVRSDPFTVPAEGQDLWWRSRVPSGIREARWLEAVEVRPSPGGRAVTHHVLVGLDQQEKGVTGLASTARDDIMSAGLLTEFAIGKMGEIYPEETGKLILPGAELEFEVHYLPSGHRLEDDRVEVGLWFYDEGEEPKYRTILRAFNASPPATLEIPPRTVTVHDRSYVLEAPARLESFQPHMHMRGKAMSMEAVLPDGRRETLAMVDRFQFAWHINYIFEPDAAPLLPAGTVLHFTVWHDNTADHPTNPDPDQFVTWGDRAVDEMGHAWVGVTYLEEEDFEALAAERRRSRDGGSSPPR